jgi:peptidoglycan/LPS O-acetylase OafA/YrhL
VRGFISILSFAMAVFGALSAIFIPEKDKQTIASIVGVAFLISFLINLDRGAGLFLHIAGIIAFILAVLSGLVAIFSNNENQRTSAAVTGIVSLGISLLILFVYIVPVQ